MKKNEKIIWHIEKRKIADLKPYFKNPRKLTKHQEKHLRLSLDKFGMIDRPCINTNNTVIGGHQRISVLKASEKEIEVMVPSRQLNEDEVEELNIRLNQNTGEFDYDMLANEFELEDLLTYGFEEQKLLYDYPGIDNLKNNIDNNEENSLEDVCVNCGQKIKKTESQNARRKNKNSKA